MKKYSIVLSLFIAAFVSACGGETTPVEVPQVEVSASNSSTGTDAERIAKILDSLNTISSKLDKLEASSKTQATNTVVTPSTPVPKPVATASTAAKPATEAVKTPEPVKTAIPAAPVSTKSTGRKVLDSIISNVYTLGAVEAELDKFEKSLENTDTSTYNLKLYSEKSKKVRLDIIYSSTTSSTGVKLTYVSGDTNKVKVRPSGALSIITTDVEKNDKRIGSINGYTLDDVDFFGMAKRYADSSYDGELTGTTKINGTDVYVLKLKCKKDNTLDKRIKAELLYFEPKTFVIRGWEAFTTEDTSGEPFYRLILKSFKVTASFPDGTFKI